MRFMALSLSSNDEMRAPVLLRPGGVVVTRFERKFLAIADDLKLASPECRARSGTCARPTARRSPNAKLYFGGAAPRRSGLQSSRFQLACFLQHTAAFWLSVALRRRINLAAVEGGKNTG